eukprot:8692326-Alexandrium_andersonii.AAC.1
MAKASHPVPLHIDPNFTFFGSESTLLAFAGLVGGTAHAGRFAIALDGLAGLALAKSPVSYTHLTLPTICSV